MSLTDEQEALFQLTLSHQMMVKQIETTMIELTGRLLEDYPAKSLSASGPNLSDRVYAPIEAFMRSLAEACFARPWEWHDFADGWRSRFAEMAAKEAIAWGLEGQIATALTALVETGLMDQRTKEHLPRLRKGLYIFASNFIQVLRMNILGREPGLLALSPEERLGLIRKIYGGESG